MSNNVIRMPQAPIVETARRLLERVESGEVRAFVFAAELEDEVLTGIASGPDWNLFSLHYGASLLPEKVREWASREDGDG